VEDSADDIGINRFTLLNLHALLSENLMADPEASGHLRRRPVEITGSVYTPPRYRRRSKNASRSCFRKPARLATLLNGRSS
jgi:hypothetical protein